MKVFNNKINSVLQETTKTLKFPVLAYSVFETGEKEFM